MQKASLIYDAKATLGEGPFWDYKSDQLFWVDIEAGVLHCHYDKTKENSAWHLEEMIGAVIPSGKETLILALETGIASFNYNTRELRPLGILENSDKKLRFNDGKCDPNGNLWIGTMHKNLKPGYGNLFKVDHELKDTLQIKNTSISNGMAWSPDKTKFYYIDTAVYEVWQFDFDVVKAEISNRKTIFKIPVAYGGADGMTIDREGMLWIAHWGGGCVRRWNPESGKVLEKIEVDAPHVTSCCFGGKDLKTLYITTARSGMSEKDLNSYPLSGGLFCYTTDVGGFKVNSFKGNL
ncbi:SMP-30/gluconolactonase/LRE family protein [uncultured Eudoraea sp.]|uniref:SMP-30/gluconolactonase/LRE family protein n=1 Tax=uncultured Eudoraea sp. TaxID=1035614 RepID=UPI0026051EB7|nr:SMP-30/gluconolactonase/LRE family protein [uncultured Eudoraea sp.]